MTPVDLVTTYEGLMLENHLRQLAHGRRYLQAESQEQITALLLQENKRAKTPLSEDFVRGLAASAASLIPNAQKNAASAPTKQGRKFNVTYGSSQSFDEIPFNPNDIYNRGETRGTTEAAVDRLNVDSIAPAPPQCSQGDPDFHYLLHADSTVPESEGLFPEREISLIGGPSGVGKTSFTIKFINAWRKGKAPLIFQNRLVCPAPFTYISFDRSWAGFRRTCKRLRVDYREFNFYRPQGSNRKLPLAALILELLGTSRHEHSKVFFIEGIDAKAHDGIRGNSDPGVVTDLMDDLLDVCEAKGITIIATAGTAKRKGDNQAVGREKVFGSVMWGRKAETIVLLEDPEPDDPKSSYRDLSLLTHNGQGDLLHLQWQNGELVPRTDLPQNPVGQTQQNATTEQRVVVWMEHNIKPCEKFRLKVAVDGLNKHRWEKKMVFKDSTVQSALDKLVNKDSVLKPEYGFYARPCVNGQTSSSDANEKSAPDGT